MTDEFNQVSFENPEENHATDTEETQVEESVETKSNTSIRPAPPMAKSEPTVKPAFMMIITLVMVLAGVGTGFGIVKATGKTTTAPTSSSASLDGRVHADAESLEVNKTYGEQEPGDNWDKVEGVLVDGGLEGEGSHHILRQGGPTQTVYVTSSYIDLDPFIGHKIEAQGETYAAQKAAWLMDVGLVKVLELNAEPPFEEKTAKAKPAVEE